MPEAVADSEQTPSVVACEGLVFLVEIGDVGKSCGEAVVLRSPEARANCKLERADALSKGKLLLVVKF